jgi:hypothetical protein
MKFTIQYQPADFVEFSHLHLADVAGYGNFKKFLIAMVVFAALSSVSIISTVLTPFSATVILVWVVVITLVIWQRFRLDKQLVKQFHDSKNMQVPITFTITDTGWTMKSSVESAEFSWEMFSHYYLNEHVLAVYRNEAVANVLPRRTFASDKEWQQLLSLVKKHVKPGEKKKGWLT